MIAVIPQPITCRISTKGQIRRDHAIPGARAPHASPRTALTITTHHLINGIAPGTDLLKRFLGRASEVHHGSTMLNTN
jgi:hypothetical protein